MTTAERKAGKHQRIKLLLDNMHIIRPDPVADDTAAMGAVRELPEADTSLTNEN